MFFTVDVYFFFFIFAYTAFKSIFFKTNNKITN